MLNIPDIVFQALTTLLGVTALFAVGLGLYWVVNRDARRRHIEELRKDWERLAPTDPNYNTARALFIAASLEDSWSQHYGAKTVSTSSASSDSGSGDGGGSD